MHWTHRVKPLKGLDLPPKSTCPVATFLDMTRLVAASHKWKRFAGLSLGRRRTGTTLAGSGGRRMPGLSAGGGLPGETGGGFGKGLPSPGPGTRVIRGGSCLRSPSRAAPEGVPPRPPSRGSLRRFPASSRRPREQRGLLSPRGSWLEARPEPRSGRPGPVR